MEDQIQALITEHEQLTRKLQHLAEASMFDCEDLQDLINQLNTHTEELKKLIEND